MVNENKSFEQIPLNESPEKETFDSDKERVKSPEKQEEEKSSKEEEKKEVDIKSDNKQASTIVEEDAELSAQKERMMKIDKILSEDMSDIFLKLPAEKQKEFKEEGEKTVIKISHLMEKTKVKVNKIIKLIKTWLGIIPNANKYYLEQEAKIKTDKILKLKDSE
ncbi:MAG: hypothetical protein ACLFNO_03335 [Parcubacteria group bacterium]